MAWRRIGKVFAPAGDLDWMKSHAALPVVVPLDGANLRIFFSARAADNRSSVGWADITLTTEGHVGVGAIASEPVLGPGRDGMYDDSGVGLGSIVPVDGGYRLYYMGWNLGVRAPWRNSIGLAQGSVTEPSFRRVADGPIMDRSAEDPFTLSYPCVVRLNDGLWHMWYGSNTSWGADKHADMNHVIKHAVSDDGVQWQREADPAFGFRDSTEYAQARPTVLAEEHRIFVWFACRGDRYRIGCAVSEDGGRTWARADDTHGLGHGDAGAWDSEMVCYPWVFRHAGRLWMAYNGNGFGATGVGLAVWED